MRLKRFVKYRRLSWPLQESKQAEGELRKRRAAEDLQRGSKKETAKRNDTCDAIDDDREAGDAEEEDEEEDVSFDVMDSQYVKTDVRKSNLCAV